LEFLESRVHIISFDVPFPPDYGGVIDVFYKIRWLHKMGVRVVLHCFAYGRKPSPFLEELCEQVYYYKRRTGLRSIFSWIPYTVLSRRSKELENNLLKDDAPILFEVLHSCFLLDDKRFSRRRRVFRHSNIEHHYYRQLSGSERSVFRKLYLNIEALKLKKFELTLQHADAILAVNRKDTEYFAARFPAVKCSFVPSFHPYEEVEIAEGRGNYILFHGNLGISENYESALWLIDNVFSDIVFDVVIAGKAPPAFLLRRAAAHKNIKVIADPSGQKMDELIAGAHIHCLHTHQPTGLKLKLLHVLFRGRFIITNRQMIDGTGLHDNSSLIVTGTSNEFVSQINRCFNLEFTAESVQERKEVVLPFRNQENITSVIEAIKGS
jgi:hypothetical protein